MLCVFAADEAVAAVIEALMGFGCFFGDPLVSETVGPTDCERMTKEKKKNKCKPRYERENLLIFMSRFRDRINNLPHV